MAVVFLLLVPNRAPISPGFKPVGHTEYSNGSGMEQVHIHTDQKSPHTRSSETQIKTKNLPVSTPNMFL